jgi:hypothetical protein
LSIIGSNIMQNEPSIGQAQRSGKNSVLVAGLGAALVASALTLAIMPGRPASAVSAAATTNQCQSLPRSMLVMTNTGGGTVRFREGGYLSPPIVLTTQPQTVVFPLPRPQTTAVDEIITIEGDATDLIIASPVTNARTTYPQLTGTFSIKKNWVPLTSCGTAPASATFK